MGIDWRIEGESNRACPGMRRSTCLPHERKASRTEDSTSEGGGSDGISIDGHAARPSTHHHPGGSRSREPSQMEERSLMIDFRGRGRPPAETVHGGYFTIENTIDHANASLEKNLEWRWWRDGHPHQGSWDTGSTSPLKPCSGPVHGHLRPTSGRRPGLKNRGSF